MQSTIRCANAKDSLAEKWITADTRCIGDGNQRGKRSDYACINDGMIDTMPLTLITILPSRFFFLSPILSVAINSRRTIILTTDDDEIDILILSLLCTVRDDSTNCTQFIRSTHIFYTLCFCFVSVSFMHFWPDT